MSYSEARASNFASLAAAKKIKANYATPARTIEQVMDCVMIALDIGLEKQTKNILTSINKELDELIATKITNIVETKLTQTFDKISELFASSEQIVFLDKTITQF